MTDDLTPDPDAMQRLVEHEQGVAALRNMADAVVVIRRTLIEGGFPDDVATEMAHRAWRQFFPGQNPLSFMFGAPPS